jgi:hypothetical protein
MRAHSATVQLTCPKCATKLGQFNWSGHECAELQCGVFIVPWLHVPPVRVDQMTLPADSEQAKLLLKTLQCVYD